MSNLRGYILTLAGSASLITETCSDCGVLYAMTEDYRKNRLRQRDTFYCPNGHSQRYRGETDEQKLKKANARELALKDQLAAATRDAEETRVALLRDRQRFANGVCPCCNRSFENVRRHMATQHPEYAVPHHGEALRFECSCGRGFDTLRGLRIHQGARRDEDWDQPGTSRYSAHLTKVGAS